MAIEGSLQEFRLPDILQMVAQQGKTGILTVQGEATIVAVSFLDGGVVAADSLQETVEERLGQVLVREGLLSRAEMDEALERQQVGEGRLVDLLVDAGFLGRGEVLEGLRLQTRELLRELLSWEAGDFKFYANDEVSYEEGFEPISVEDLLLSSLGDFADDGGEVEGEAEAEEEAGEAGGEAPLLEVPELPTGLTEPDLPEPDLPGAVEEVEPPPPGPRPVPEPQEESGEAAAEGGALPDIDEPAVPSSVPAPGPEAVPETGAEPAAVPSWAAPPRRRRAGRPVAAVLPPVVGALLAVVLLVALGLAPNRFLLPLPWQSAERQELVEVQRQAAFRTIDRAAKIYFLLEGHFPDDLDDLVSRSLLEPDDRIDPGGQPLRFQAREESYELRPRGAGEDEASVEAVTGDFLLDPEYFSSAQGDAVPPLVLLD